MPSLRTDPTGTARRHRAMQGTPVQTSLDDLGIPLVDVVFCVLDIETTGRESGILYALGGSGGGLALWLDEGRLVYLYNMMIIER